MDVRVDERRRNSTQVLADPRADGGPAADGAERGILGSQHASRECDQASLMVVM